MPGGYRLAVLALGLILHSELGQAQEQTEGGETAAPEQAQPAPSLPLPFPVEIIEDDERAETRERSEAEAAQREKDDLLAQQGMNAATQAMNDATQRMAFYSLLSTVLVAIGTGLLIWTLCLTRRANKAAMDAVEVTREVGQKQIRAYCGVDSAEIAEGEPDSAGPGYRKVSAAVTVKNSGQTPAFQAHGWITCNSYSIKSGKIRRLEKGVPRSRMPLGAGAAFRLETPLKVPNEAELPDEQIFIIGFWKYRDCFGARHLV